MTFDDLERAQALRLSWEAADRTLAALGGDEARSIKIRFDDANSERLGEIEAPAMLAAGCARHARNIFAAELKALGLLVPGAQS